MATGYWREVLEIYFLVNPFVKITKNVCLKLQIEASYIIIIATILHLIGNKSVTKPPSYNSVLLSGYSVYCS